MGTKVSRKKSNAGVGGAAQTVAKVARRISVRAHEPSATTETEKKDLQSAYEDLMIVNDELRARNVEVSQINSDLVNLLNTVDVPILILDKHRGIRRFTPKARNILNVLPTDVGRRLDDIRPNIDVPDLDRQISDVIETMVAKESEVQDRDGRWYRMQIRPYKTAENHIDGAIVSLFDIDSLKSHISEVQQAKEEAERADQAKDQFLAVLSHELRTPLSALLIQAQLLRQVGSDSVKRDRACDAIERSTKMQVQLIDDLLDVSRIVTGKLKVALEPVNLVAVVKATLDTMEAFAESRAIELRTFLDQSVGPVSGDRTRLEQVVLNLLSNAIKFTPEGGRVDVVLEKVGGLAHLRVSDNGMGIDSHFLPRIFNRLTQKDSSSTRPHGGLGLGLAIVRHLVDAHGGTVRAESLGTGHGATFHVTLASAGGADRVRCRVGRAVNRRSSRRATRWTWGRQASERAADPVGRGRCRHARGTGRDVHRGGRHGEDGAISGRRDHQVRGVSSRCPALRHRDVRGRWLLPHSQSQGARPREGATPLRWRSPPWPGRRIVAARFRKDSRCTWQSPSTWTALRMPSWSSWKAEGP